MVNVELLHNFFPPQTYFTDAGQHVDGRSKVTDVKDWQVELDETVVTRTSCAVFSAGKTGSILLIRPLVISTLSRTFEHDVPFFHQGVHSLPLSVVHRLHAHTNPRRQLPLLIFERYWRVSEAEIGCAYCSVSPTSYRADGELTFF